MGARESKYHDHIVRDVRVFPVGLVGVLPTANVCTPRPSALRLKTVLCTRSMIPCVSRRELQKFCLHPLGFPHARVFQNDAHAPVHPLRDACLAVHACPSRGIESKRHTSRACTSHWCSVMSPVRARCEANVQLLPPSLEEDTLEGLTQAGVQCRRIGYLVTGSKKAGVDVFCMAVIIAAATAAAFLPWLMTNRGARASVIGGSRTEIKMVWYSWLLSFYCRHSLARRDAVVLASVYSPFFLLIVRRGRCETGSTNRPLPPSAAGR